MENEVSYSVQLDEYDDGWDIGYRYDTLRWVLSNGFKKHFSEVIYDWATKLVVL